MALERHNAGAEGLTYGIRDESDPHLYLYCKLSVYQSGKVATLCVLPHARRISKLPI